eukprot:364398-Chlamydomonas_euryale.AAC.4
MARDPTCWVRRNASRRRCKRPRCWGRCSSSLGVHQIVTSRPFAAHFPCRPEVVGSQACAADARRDHRSRSVISTDRSAAARFDTPRRDDGAGAAARGAGRRCVLLPRLCLDATGDQVAG